MAFMDPQAIGLQLWDTLAAAALGVPLTDAKMAVGNRFYDLYETAGPGGQDDGEEDSIATTTRPRSGATTEKPKAYLDKGAEAQTWTKVATHLAQHQGGALGEALGDSSVGKVTVQGNPNEAMVRLYESYNDGPPVGRLQFVVTFGGGTVLFNRMRRACQTYLQGERAVDPSQFCINEWKVFGAAAGKGRSDSCVVYLRLPYADPAVQDFIKNHMWPNLKDVVADQFRPYGLCAVQAGRPFWGLDYPAAGKFLRVLAINRTIFDNNYTSAGGMMGLYLGRAFELALQQGPKSTSTNPSEVRSALIGLAKPQLDNLLRQLE